MAAKYFVEFFKKYPQQFSEMFVLKQIVKTLCCAKKALKKHPDGDAHIKYVCKAHHMLQAYFAEKGIDPNAHM